MTPEHDPQELLARSSLLVSQADVRAAVDRMAAQVNEYYGDTPLIMLIVMTGAVMPAAWLASRLKMPLQMDFMHATRYTGTTEGGEIEFRVPPRLNLQDLSLIHISEPTRH